MEETTYYDKWLQENPNYFKEYTVKNREKLNAYHRAYYAKNRKKMSMYNKAYYKRRTMEKKKKDLEDKIAKFKASLV
jgi:hypothetical protein